MKALLNIGGIAAVAFSLWAGWADKHAVMSAGMLASFCLLFAGNLDRISEFRAGAGGFSAKTRNLINEASSILMQLQNLARIMATTELSLVVRSGRFGTYSDDEKEQVRQQVLRILDELEVSKQEQERVLADWHRFTILDYGHAILGGSRVPDHLSDEQIEEWKRVRGGGAKDPPSPDDIEHFLESVNVLTDEKRGQLEDHRHYLVHHKHRRPREWKLRNTWTLGARPAD